MVARREQEGAAGGAQDGRQAFQPDINIDAEGGQHVGTAGARRQRAVAVLGHRHAAACQHEGDGGGDVEAAGRVAAGAADVDRALRGVDAVHAGAHRTNRTGEFGDGLAADPHRHHQAGDLRRGGFAGHDGGEGGFGLGLVQRLAGGDAGEDGFEIAAHKGSGPVRRRGPGCCCRGRVPGSSAAARGRGRWRCSRGGTARRRSAGCGAAGPSPRRPRSRR